MHSTAAFPRSCSIASAILFSMWKNDFVKEGGRGQAFYSQGPCLMRTKVSPFSSKAGIHGGPVKITLG